MEAIHHRLIILGAGPAGYTAAIYAARANLNPVIITGLQPGGQLMTTTEVDNWPGDHEGVQGPDLMERMRLHAARFNTGMINDSIKIADLQRRPFMLEGDSARYSCDALIIATGASAKWLDLGVDKKLSGRGVSTCATCDGFFFKGRPVAVIGGGDTAMEEAIYLSKLATAVTVIHRRDTLRASKVMQDKAMSMANISFIWNTDVVDIKDVDKGEVTALVLHNNKTGEKSELAVDGVFIGIGHVPNTKLFQGQLALHDNGYLKTHDGSRTSVAGVFAAGDVQDHIYRQAVTAAGSGCMAAIDAERFLSGTLHEESEKSKVGSEK
jgi:thioredoxin reductase (NADPH)